MGEGTGTMATSSSGFCLRQSARGVASCSLLVRSRRLGHTTTTQRHARTRAMGSDDEGFERQIEQNQVSQMRRQLDKQYMEGKIEDAVQDAKEVCEETDAASKDCAIAWEEVEELRFASKRKAGEAESVSADPFAPTTPDEDEVENVNFQQELQRQDFLSDVLPCDIDSCEDPGGTFLAAAALENSFGGSSSKTETLRTLPSDNAKKAGQRVTDLKQEIQIAIGEAFDVCGSGLAQDCSAAWDKVEDLSYQLDKEEDKL